MKKKSKYKKKIDFTPKTLFLAESPLTRWHGPNKGFPFCPRMDQAYCALNQKDSP